MRRWSQRDRALLQAKRPVITLVAIICNDRRVQPELPQWILANSQRGPIAGDSRASRRERAPASRVVSLDERRRHGECAPGSRRYSLAHGTREALRPLDGWLTLGRVAHVRSCRQRPQHPAPHGSQSAPAGKQSEL